MIKAENWVAWKFQIVDGAGTEVGRITKTWEGLAKTLFTTADNYMVQFDQRARGPAPQPRHRRRPLHRHRAQARRPRPQLSSVPLGGEWGLVAPLVFKTSGTGTNRSVGSIPAASAMRENERPPMRLLGPVLDTDDPLALADFYQRLPRRGRSPSAKTGGR